MNNEIENTLQAIEEMEAKLKQIVPQNIDEANLLSDLTSEAVFLKDTKPVSNS